MTDKTKATHVVVVGNGMVGQRLVDKILAGRNGGGTDKQLTITVIGAEPVAAYNRVALSSYFDGATIDDLSLSQPSELRDAGVDLKLGVEVTSIDAAARSVRLNDGSNLDYDHLVLATGSDPFVPPVPGADRPGCFVYRTLADLEAIQGWAAKDRVTTGVVVGGGLLGLEAANALLNLDVETHVVEMADRIMPQQLDEPASEMLLRWVNELGVRCHLGFRTEAIVGADLDADLMPNISATKEASAVAGLRTPDGFQLDAQIVVYSAGIRPRDQLAAASGLAIGERGGVVIDDQCQTSDRNISAIGEVACHAGRTYGLVGPGYEMATVVADRLLGGSREFKGADTSTKLKLLGVEVATFGVASVDDDRVEFSDPQNKIHRRVSISDGKVTGGVLVGDVAGYDVLHAMSTGVVPSTNVDRLVAPSTGDAAVVGLADGMQLCTCNDVTRGQCKESVNSGVHTLAELKSCTTAGTACGGCLPDLALLLEAELDVLGIERKRSLCSHFDHSRQDLFDLIRYHRHSSWRDVITSHGSGRGCDICRPTVGSILASLSNGYILDGDQAALQDTNDHALANMQRDGTYSVVPRVPGGEITPAQLIELGQIAQDFDLYTKITGAQRIDLFGAQLHELPLIWQRVIDVGLESGHAYGKSLRTVKSCVGDTWCRYGVQDSVSMAIRLERRYRGLRSPHKLKSGVSGCSRECAEAQSKDFGVIATENGWNLYLGGNGGKTPRHAQLFAADLDDEQLITYIDRFLMFYIRTADRLQRTAPWLQALEGGIDHLRSVIVEDSLGICNELDSDIASHVEKYECEWSATLADPARLDHFVEFVNAPDQTSTPVRITERGQKVPAQ